MSDNKTTTEVDKKNLPQPADPELHPPPEPVQNNSTGESYTKAREDITPRDVGLIENFIGSIYGEAKQIENNNIGDNKYTKALKMDAVQEIVNVRNAARGQVNAAPPPVQQANIQQPTIPLPPLPGQQMDHPPPVESVRPEQRHLLHQQVNHGDSLILKHEIDQLKEQLKDIKKLYDEFFKLKQVKGHWKIKADGKTQSTTTISKTWNVLNKLLKNKSTSIIIEYVEDE